MFGKVVEAIGVVLQQHFVKPLRLKSQDSDLVLGSVEGANSSPVTILQSPASFNINCIPLLAA